MRKQSYKRLADILLTVDVSLMDSLSLYADVQKHDIFHTITTAALFYVTLECYSNILGNDKPLYQRAALGIKRGLSRLRV